MEETERLPKLSREDGTSDAFFSAYPKARTRAKEERQIRVTSLGKFLFLRTLSLLFAELFPRCCSILSRCFWPKYSIFWYETVEFMPAVSTWTMLVRQTGGMTRSSTCEENVKNQGIFSDLFSHSSVKTGFGYNILSGIGFIKVWQSWSRPFSAWIEA